MKNIKLIVLSIALLAFGFTSCKKCDNENPRAKVVNNGTQSVSVQIKTSNGNTENINNIDPGTSSAYSSYASGDVMFTISVGKNDFIKTVSMSKCYEYSIVIDANNQISSLPVDRND